eukprot:404739_1
MVDHVSILSQYYILITCVFLSQTLSFMIPPAGILPSNVLAEHRSLLNKGSETWHQPKLNEPFASFWYYWHASPGHKTSDSIDYGVTKWLFNGTHMYYHFTIPLMNSEFHEYIMNDTLYLWT